MTTEPLIFQIARDYDRAFTHDELAHAALRAMTYIACAPDADEREKRATGLATAHNRALSHVTRHTLERRLSSGDHNEPAPLPIHRTEAGYPNCSTCDGGGCPDCTDPA